MVLYHVAQCASLLVERAAAFDAKGFSHGDLHVVNVVTFPDRLEDAVGEPEDQEILNGFLAQVVIDAEDLALAEDCVDLVVELAGGVEVVSERFFNDDGGAAILRFCQALCAEILNNACKELGCSGEVEEAIWADGFFFGNAIEFGFKCGVVAGIIKVEREIADLPDEFVELGVTRVRATEFNNAFAHVFCEFVAERTPRHANDGELPGQQIGLEEVKECRQQFALGEIARRAEDGRTPGSGMRSEPLGTWFRSSGRTFIWMVAIARYPLRSSLQLLAFSFQLVVRREILSTFDEKLK